MAYSDRYEAGQALGRALAEYLGGGPEMIVLGLPRGGVPVASRVAEALHAPLDVFIVRKLGVPGHEELGLGAIASGGVRVINPELVRSLGLSNAIIDSVSRREEDELRRREEKYRQGRPALHVHGRTVILVDDGLATGSTMLAAVRAIRQMEASSIIVAVPVASDTAVALISREADEVVSLMTPSPFFAVGEWYRDFTQTSDEEVEMLLERAADRQVV